MRYLMPRNGIVTSVSIRIRQCAAAYLRQTCQLLFLGLFFCAVCIPPAYSDQSLLPDAVSAWQPGPLTPLVRDAPNGQDFFCPFMPDAIRHYWDCDLQVDLSASDGLEVEYTCDNPGAFQSITWYWRAGKGWRAAALPVRQGRTRHWIPKSDFEDQGVPDGWSATSGYRVSPWSAKRGAGRLILHAARHKSAAIAIARPGAEVFANAAERARR